MDIGLCTYLLCRFLTLSLSSSPSQSHRHYRNRDKPTPVLPRFPNLQEVKDKKNPELSTDKVSLTCHWVDSTH